MKKYLLIPPLFLTLFLTISIGISTTAQGIYTARGYWEESNKPNYREIKQKQLVGYVLSQDELSYLLDFETYLNLQSRGQIIGILINSHSTIK